MTGLPGLDTEATMAPDRSQLAAELKRRAESMRGRATDLLERLTALDSESGEPAALEPSCELLGAELERLGAAPTRHVSPAGIHLEAGFGAGPGSPLLLLCHYDTVWAAGTAAARPLRFDGERAIGPGVFDMRGGIVAALCALELLLASDRVERPLTLLLTADEETGGESSSELIIDRGLAADLTLVPEPSLPGGAIKTRRKGWSTYELRVAGRSAHAGLEPERGVSAIDELVDQLASVRGLADPAAGTTINCGVIDGGQAANVVAEAAFAELDLRAATVAEYERVDLELHRLAPRRDGSEIKLTRRHTRPPMERTAPIAAAAERALGLAAELGLELGEGAAGGASDANQLAAQGAAVLDGLGPEGGGAHAEDEWVSLDSLCERVALLALLIAEL